MLFNIIFKTQVKNADPSEYKEVCKRLRIISVSLKCCGYNDSLDYPINARDECCHNVADMGCAKKVVHKINSRIRIFTISNVLELMLELIFLLIFPFLIGQISGKSSNRKSYTPVRRTSYILPDN